MIQIIEADSFKELTIKKLSIKDLIYVTKPESFKDLTNCKTKLI